MSKTVQGEYLTFRDRPLVRQDDTICYGDMTEKCVLVLEIISYSEKSGTRLPEKVMIQIIDSKDPNRIIRQGIFVGLHEAFSMGLIWLETALQ